MYKRVLLFSNDTAKKMFEPHPRFELGRKVHESFSSLDIYVKRLIERTGFWWEISEIYYVEREAEADEEPNIRAIIYSEYGDCRTLYYRRNFGRKSRDNFHWTMQNETQPYARFEDWNQLK